MSESFKKDLIRRYNDERRLTHPQWDLFLELLLDITRGSENLEKKHSKRLEELETLLFIFPTKKEYTLPVYVGNQLYHAVMHEPLDTDIDIPDEFGGFSIKKIHLMQALAAYRRACNEILSDIARRYYLDIEFHQEGGQDIATEL